MQANHTPGPWTANGIAVTAPARHAASQRIADCRALLPDTELRANAALIAAAPDLLAALQALIDGVIRHEVREDYHKHYSEIAAARAAIARAIGA